MGYDCEMQLLNFIKTGLWNAIRTWCSSAKPLQKLQQEGGGGKGGQTGNAVAEGSLVYWHRSLVLREGQERRWGEGVADGVT